MAEAPVATPAPAAQVPTPTPTPAPDPGPTSTPTLTPAPVAVAPVAASPNVTKLPEATPTPEPDPFASLKPENKQLVESSGWKSLDAVVESYNSLRQELRNKGMLGDLPKDATPEQRAEWNKSRGRPNVAGEYTLSMPQEMPKDMPYDGTFAETFRQWSFDVGLTPWQADALHNRYVNMMASSFKESGEKANSDVTASHADLVQAWGAEGSDKYNRNVEMATRALRHLDPGLSDALKEIGVLASDGTVVKAAVAKALAVAGHKLYGEDTLYGSGNTVINNPWAKGKENLTEQGRIFQADPDRARRLAKAAGVNLTI